MALSVGDLAPEFDLSACTGENIKLSDLRGKTVILYFYPKDDTPGCTQEAKDFTELKSEFDLKNAVILGVSKDSVQDHCAFRDKYALQVTLLADENLSVIKAYDVWGEKSMYGKKYFGIERATFVIDPEGKIKEIFRKVKVTDHAAKVLKALS